MFSIQRWNETIAHKKASIVIESWLWWLFRTLLVHLVTYGTQWLIIFCPLLKKHFKKNLKSYRWTLFLSLLILLWSYTLNKFTRQHLWRGWIWPRAIIWEIWIWFLIPQINWNVICSVNRLRPAIESISDFVFRLVCNREQDLFTIILGTVPGKQRKGRRRIRSDMRLFSLGKGQLPGYGDHRVSIKIWLWLGINNTN